MTADGRAREQGDARRDDTRRGSDAAGSRALSLTHNRTRSRRCLDADRRSSRGRNLCARLRPGLGQSISFCALSFNAAAGKHTHTHTHTEHSPAKDRRSLAGKWAACAKRQDNEREPCQESLRLSRTRFLGGRNLTEEGWCGGKRDDN
jgi:hypothetical protein